MEEVMKGLAEELDMINDNACSRKKDKDNKIVDKRYLGINFPIGNLSVEERLVKPFKYLMTQHGKNLRKKLVLSLNYWMKAPKEVENGLLEIMYLAHNCGLMADDIQDKSVLRRGIPCAHLVFGTARTMNTFHFFVGRILEIISSFGNPAAVELFRDMAIDSIRGQTMDVCSREQFKCPTEDEYKLAVLGKTGTVFLFILKYLAIYSKEDVDMRTLTRLMAAFGFYFQINDDFVNLWSQEYQESKGFCEDITEGNFSFPIMYVINNFPEEGKIVEDILRQQTNDIEVLQYCRSVMEKCGALEHTRKEIIKYKNRITEEKNKLKPNPIFEDLLNQDFFIPESAVVI